MVELSGIGTAIAALCACLAMFTGWITYGVCGEASAGFSGGAVIMAKAHAILLFVLGGLTLVALVVGR